MLNTSAVALVTSALFAVGTAGVATAAPAAPTAPRVALGGCSSFPPTPCGEVQNNSNRTVRVSLNWTCTADTGSIGSTCPKDIKSVGAGRHIGGGSVDVDAFEVPTGCTFAFDIDGLNLTRGAGWYKFSSLNTVTIHRATC